MNAQLEHTTVTLTPTAPTPKGLSTAPVTRGTLGMESRVLVSKNSSRNDSSL